MTGYTEVPAGRLVEAAAFCLKWIEDERQKVRFETIAAKHTENLQDWVRKSNRWWRMLGKPLPVPSFEEAVEEIERGIPFGLSYNHYMEPEYKSLYRTLEILALELNELGQAAIKAQGQSVMPAKVFISEKAAKLYNSSSWYEHNLIKETL